MAVNHTSLRSDSPCSNQPKLVTIIIYYSCWDQNLLTRILYYYICNSRIRYDSSNPSNHNVLPMKYKPSYGRYYSV